MSIINRHKKWLLYLGLITFIVLFLWMSCTQKAPIDPINSIRDIVPTLVNMNSSLDQIIVGGGQTYIRVQLVNATGVPMPDELIQFSTTLGYITPSDTTNIPDAGFSSLSTIVAVIVV